MHLGKLGGIGGVPGKSIGEGVAEEEESLLALLDLPLLVLPPQAGPAQEYRQGRSRGHHAFPAVEEEKADEDCVRADFHTRWGESQRNTINCTLHPPRYKIFNVYLMIKICENQT